MTETRDEAHKAFNRIVKRFKAKYPGAMEYLAKDREEMLPYLHLPGNAEDASPHDQSDRINIRQVNDDLPDDLVKISVAASPDIQQRTITSVPGMAPPDNGAAPGSMTSSVVGLMAGSGSLTFETTAHASLYEADVAFSQASFERLIALRFQSN